MPYGEQTQYAKYLNDKSSGCDNDGNECGCCPIGLVAVYDGQGRHVACLTPEDADEYNANNFKCADGMVKLFKNSTEPPTFMGCVAAEDFAALNESING